jgi:hypothetical protein
MTVRTCPVEGLDLGAGEISITQEIQIAKEYHGIMSSPGMAPESNPRRIFPPIEGDDNYVMVPYREIAAGLTRGRTSPWIPISMIMTWVVLSAIAMLVVKSRNDGQALQPASQSQTQTILKLASSIGAQHAQPDTASQRHREYVKMLLGRTPPDRDFKNGMRR